MSSRTTIVFRASAIAAAVLLSSASLVSASRCKSRNGGGPHCGLDNASSGGGCTDASIANLPLKCPPGQTTVIYDLDRPFPPDPTKTSHAVLRSAPNAPCANMGDLPVPITGYAVGCWTPPDQNGCRAVSFLNGGTMCMHLQDERLGAVCGSSCSNVSTEQVAVSNAGAAEHFVCPPIDATTSCRATRSPGLEGFRLWFGGFCSTNGCSDPGTDPMVGTNTCVSQWGASFFGYARGKSLPLGFGWYDWQSGAFKVDYRNGRATCGQLGSCIGSGRTAPWDLSLVAVPRSATPPPCLLPSQSSPCDGAACTP